MPRTPAEGPVDPLLPLVRRVQAGDLAAFDALYQATRHRVHGALFQLVGSNAEMEDLIQEVYVQLLRAIPGFRGEARFTTFVHRLCCNVGLTHLRARRRRPEDPVDQVPEQEAPPSSDPERAAQVQQAAGVMERALGALSEEKREVFVAHELLGLRPEEISLAVGAPTNTVRSRLNRARTAFTAEVSRLLGGRK